MCIHVSYVLGGTLVNTSTLIGMIPFFLMGAILIPEKYVNSQPKAFARVARFTLLTALLIFMSGLINIAMESPNSFGTGGLHAIPIWTMPDPVALIMACLIAFIGWIITTFSLHYLDGDPNQGRFLKHVCFTLGSVLVLVLSNNLGIAFLGWIFTSLGLHLLLCHYPERNWAIWAARKKFLVSRLGDLFFLGAIALVYSCFGSLDYAEIFTKCEAIRESNKAAPAAVTLVGVLLVLAAITKSAQFPFHTWLPDTMETPTPVSALMHAGVINAGGFLVIRLSPILTLSSLPLDILLVMGTFTALLGSLLMLTQTSIKRSLAYSTVAQMGFMMLQCGIGAFTAALLHILAHSFYKAHAFLSSGGILETAKPADHSPDNPNRLPSPWALPLAILAALALGVSSYWLLGSHGSAGTGGIMLCFILVLALTQLLWPNFSRQSSLLALVGVLQSIVVCGCYLAAYHLLWLATSGKLDIGVPPPGLLDMAALAMVLAGFLGIFLLQILMDPLGRFPWMRALHVHAMHGFYMDIPSRKLAGMFWGKSYPVP